MMSMDSNPHSPTLDPYSDAFERVGPAVASIGSQRANGRRTGQGSGVIYTPDGYVLTNSHVIKGAAKLFASLPNGREYEAVLVSDDPETDLAVVAASAERLTWGMVSWRSTTARRANRAGRSGPRPSRY